MALNNVVDNIKNKGLHETHRIYLCRKYNLVPREDYQSVKRTLSRTSKENNERKNTIKEYRSQINLSDMYHKRLLALTTMRGIMQQNACDLNKVDLLIDDMLKSALTLTSEKLEAWNDKIKQLENKAYRLELKRLYIKSVIPNTYESYSNKEIDNRKIVFLQPRRGLNQTFRYIYRQMKSSGQYDPKLIELSRGEVSMTEHYLNAVDFAKEAATAKAIMLHESSEYLGYIDFRPGTKVIQLWHGCGIIKHLGHTNAGKPGYKSIEEYEEFPEYNKYDLVTMAGEGLRSIFEDFMGKKSGDPVLQSMGMSRTDEFFDEEYIRNCYHKLYEKIPNAEGKKIILYAPTYRGTGSSRIAPRALDVAKFAKELSNDYILIIKQHQTAKELPEIPEEYKDRFAYDMTRGRGMDINELMTVSDICISDYSSVVFEFSLFERPIIFFMYDLDEYEDTRGMYYSFEELAECGPIFKTNDEMIAYIANIDEEFDRAKVVAFKNKFMSACDGHATERILKYIES